MGKKVGKNYRHGGGLKSFMDSPPIFAGAPPRYMATLRRPCGSACSEGQGLAGRGGAWRGLAYGLANFEGGGEGPNSSPSRPAAYAPRIGGQICSPRARLELASLRPPTGRQRRARVRDHGLHGRAQHPRAMRSPQPAPAVTGNPRRHAGAPNVVTVASERGPGGPQPWP